MTAQEAWELLQEMGPEQAPLRRWTQSGSTREEFTFRLRGDGKRPGIAFFRDGREVKSASFARFARFFESWNGGNRSPDAFRNDGEKSSKAAVIHFLLPVFERLSAATAPAGVVAGDSQYKYGKRTWELALEAVKVLGGRATRHEVLEYITRQVPGFNAANVEPDLNMLAVNSYSRGNFSTNRRPRRSDSGSPYDALYLDRSGSEPRFALYEPAKHGVWELAELPGHKQLRPRLVEEARVQRELEAERTKAEEAGDFDPADETDARKKDLAAIVRRQGQGKFRQELLDAYGRRCAITDCDAEDALEAAHIRGYLGTHRNVVPNGLLLRADIHTLFDLGLIRIDPESMTVALASKLLDTKYGELAGRKLRLPSKVDAWPNREALRMHGEQSIAF